MPVLLEEMISWRRVGEVVQPAGNEQYLSTCIRVGYSSHERPAVCANGFDIVHKGLRVFPMASVKQFEMRGRRIWCAIVILVAVCSLTVNVATRYGSAAGISTHTVKATVKDASTDAQRQRLAKDAANWITPVSNASPLQAPTLCPRIAPEGAPVPHLFFADALYNRPPPSAQSLV
jgi:hypothetical protein